MILLQEFSDILFHCKKRRCFANWKSFVAEAVVERCVGVWFV
jgi:hypothetical protein